MGAFPSHDAPELNYTAVVTQPETNRRVEVCLVPLLPRYFNDGHKRVKNKLNDILAQKVTALQATSNLSANINAKTPASTSSGPATTAQPPAPIGTKTTTLSATASKALGSEIKRLEGTGGTALVDYIIAATEPLFFVNTKDAVLSASLLRDEHNKKKTGALDSTTLKAVGIGDELSSLQQHTSLSHLSTHYSRPHLLRPLPFAICILDPDGFCSEHGSSAAQPHLHASKHQHTNQSNAGNIITIKGCRLQLVGFLSCCMDQEVCHLNTTLLPKMHVYNGGGGNSQSSAHGLGNSQKKDFHAVLDIIFDDAAVHGFLTESVVLLASFAFRKQFVNCCALYYPFGDEDVETAFDYHMSCLQLKVVLRHDDYKGLRMFHTHYPLLDMIKELGLQEAPSTHYSYFEDNFGDYGLEVTFSKNFLVKWMRYVESKVQVESVNGYHVRCVVNGLLQERNRLIQERQDSGVFLDEEEEEERLFGNALFASALKHWIVVGHQKVLQKQAQFASASPMMLFAAAPGGAAAAAGGGPGGAAPGGFWPHMPPVMMAMPHGWPANVMPLSVAPPPPPPPPPIPPPPVGQQSQFVVPGGRPPVYYAAPPHVVHGGAPFVAGGGGVQILQQPAAPAPSAVPQQQIVYVLPSGQIAPTAGLQHAQAAVYPQGVAPQVYYAPPPTYAVPYNTLIYQQAQAQAQAQAHAQAQAQAHAQAHQQNE